LRSATTRPGGGLEKKSRKKGPIWTRPGDDSNLYQEKEEKAGTVDQADYRRSEQGRGFRMN